MLDAVYLIIVSESVANDNSKAFGRGLFQLDPAEAQKKAQIQNNYKEELRKQMQADKDRKLRQKQAIRKEQQLREKRFYQQLRLEEEAKNGKKNPQDRGLYGLNERPSNQNNIQQVKQSKQSPLKLYEHSQSQPPPKLHFENSPPKRIQQYSPPAYFNHNHIEEDRQFHEASENKLRFFRESLDQKVEELYKQIKSSKEVLQVDRQLQNLRRKLHTYGVEDELNPKDTGKFQYQFSHFYKIPKKSAVSAVQPKRTQLDSRTLPKNLTYQSQSNYKKDNFTDRNNELGKSTKPYQSSSNRNIGSRGFNSNNEQWGKKKGKQTYLGDREALDFQIQTMLGNISNLLDEHQE